MIGADKSLKRKLAVCDPSQFLQFLQYDSDSRAIDNRRPLHLNGKSIYDINHENSRTCALLRVIV